MQELQTKSTINPQTRERLTELSQQAQIEFAKRSYAGYFKLANQQEHAQLFALNRYLCGKLQKIIDGERHFYIVEMPPQHGKSLTITKTFPSYYLMKNPDKNVMITTYTQSLFSLFADDNRKKFAKFAPAVAGLQIDRNMSNEFTIKDHTGSFYATSIYGGATGRTANLLILDDPVKNAQEARSATMKAGLIDEWQRSFFTRMHPDTSVILIMTRWAVDDLAGTLLKQKAMPWEELKLPAIAENIPDGETDEIGRHNGDYLCPEVQSGDQIELAKKTVSPEAFAAMYQQRPVLEGGNLLKNEYFRYYVPDRKTLIDLGLQNDDKTVVLPPMERKFSSWDLTFTANENSDFTAGQVWGKSGPNYYLLNRVNARLAFPEQIDAIKAVQQQFPDISATYIEDKANGSAVMSVINQYVPGIIPVTPIGDKVERANAVLGYFRGGNVFVPHPRWQPEVRDMLDQWTAFPNVEHDDEVDSMTQALSQDSQAGFQVNILKSPF